MNTMRDHNTDRIRNQTQYGYDNCVVIADLDGTLIDSDTSIADIITGVLREFGFGKEHVRLAYECLENGRSGDEATMVFGLDREKRMKIEERLKSELLKRTYNPVPEVHKSLASLKEDGFEFAIATANYADNTMRVLKETGLDAFFKQELVFTYDNFHAKKPSAEVTAEIMKRSGRTNAVVVGNTAKDILFARNSGLPVVLIKSSAVNEYDGLDCLAGELAGYPTSDGWRTVPDIVKKLMNDRKSTGA